MKKRETFKANGLLYRELDGLPFEFTGEKITDKPGEPNMYEIWFDVPGNPTFYAYEDEVYETATDE